MTFQTKMKFLAPALLGFALSQTGFAAPMNTCANVGTPVGGYVTIDCNLSYNGSPNSFNLSGLFTQPGSSGLDNNEVGASYTVLINGNPSTLADNLTGLGNQSLWEAVLYFPSDPLDVGYSDTLDVYWPGSFPSFSTVQSFDQALYGVGTDADFFVQATGTTTVIGPGSNDVFSLTVPAASVAAPEPASFTLLASGILGLGLLVATKRARGCSVNPASR